MSILDDLKKQAQDKNTLQSQDLSQTLQKNELNWHKLAPKLYIIMNYFKEVAETLNVVEPEEISSFNITKNFALKNLKKRNFRVMKDKEGTGRTFSFRYDMTAISEQRAAVGNEGMAGRLRNILMQEKIDFSEVPESQTRIVFLIKPTVTTTFTYAADVENCMVNLIIKNYDGIMVQTIRYKPESITDELLDETVKFILRRGNRFMELSGYVMSEELRKNLQDKLQKDNVMKAKTGVTDTQDLLDSTISKFSSIFKK